MPSIPSAHILSWLHEPRDMAAGRCMHPHQLTRGAHPARLLAEKAVIRTERASTELPWCLRPLRYLNEWFRTLNTGGHKGWGHALSHVGLRAAWPIGPRTV